MANWPFHRRNRIECRLRLCICQIALDRGNENIEVARNGKPTIRRRIRNALFLIEQALQVDLAAIEFIVDTGEGVFDQLQCVARSLAPRLDRTVDFIKRQNDLFWYFVRDRFVRFLGTLLQNVHRHPRNPGSLRELQRFPGNLSNALFESRAAERIHDLVPHAFRIDQILCLGENASDLFRHDE